MNPGVSEGGTAILDRGRELIGRALRVVGTHPLLAGPQVKLGPQARLGLLGQFAHASSGLHMVASACRLELDLVEVFDVRHSSHGTPAALLNSDRFDVRSGTAARGCETSDSRSPPDHGEIAG